MNEQRIREILDRIRNVTVAVYGDFCLDAYWILDPKGSEVSVETGLQAHAVARHYYSLGGASNVVANLAALEPRAIQVIGAVGDDLYGRELRRQLDALGVDTTSLVIQRENYDTVTFAKPYLEDREQPRMDFGFCNRRTSVTDEALLAGIRHALETADALIVNQQVPGSIPNESFIDKANALFAEFDEKVVLLDSRHYGGKFKGIYRKTNDREAAMLNGVEVGLDEGLPLEDVRTYARRLFEQFHRPVFLTRGPRGILSVDRDGLHEVPGIQLLKKLDPVGAGDTVTSALALCLGAGVSCAEAAEFANLAAAVTVQKLFQTGTASGEEILAVGQSPDYIYQPELAEDPRKARYLEGSDIELCEEAIPFGRIKHAVFDADGTVSTLRQGWEQVMAPVMIEAVLGERYRTADVSVYEKVRRRVLEYIDQSTGIQTILQMEALVEMVREFGFVPADKVLDKFGYKDIYNRALMEVVNQRIARFERGQLDVSDFTVKGAVDFLAALRNRGVTLYLASGTDREDVVRESHVLGYAEFFNGGIYGAVGDVTKYSKRMVIDRIMTENHLSGPELAVVGDGPVEMRECRKRGGIAVGIASDEVRRHGLNLEKRTRLIKAGAQVVVPDFSQWHDLLDLLFGR
ncbi:MAG: PfkB family carbohydrate kinase [Sedimentisphaerales bacterium]|jgi:rfaE bifunctional protein kinase chain/domain|nr:PfkB family carbohydrate kinase [Sedimentisphaerales bacterium]HNY79186.1 PfkB family carbohydrate kinase [Sedimentisphaerales bacterium]HOC64228.1 PfkB family carbohydrate kinase [Sedimentisphaerales bacterium]HOH65094.1 PfkB family carbohydrate kinase [Sedimentisphaerales bacterium]HPY48664.1 PfkB family carbohydrate kinase [Sedimentisphaerales bacterium]